MKRSVKITLIVVVILVLAGIGVGLYMYNLKSPDLSKGSADYTMASGELQSAFEVDEVGASSKYVNKIIEVTGPVMSYGPGYDTYSLALETASPYSFIICTFQKTPENTPIEVGVTLTVRGICSGYLMDVLMNDCVIITK